MSQATYVIQHSFFLERFCQVEQRPGRKEQRVVMAPWLDRAKHFDSSFEAESFAQGHFAAETYRVRTMVDGELLPAGKEAVKA